MSADPGSSPMNIHGAAPRIVTSSALFGEQSEVHIIHNGVSYRLRITRQDKLILTK
ncbi:MAG: hemin uptake protein HemP [Alphaproteobacteria bacterium]|nr:hemin uptake protein HemP [Alphaproteobacteria bacterium]